MADTMKFRGNQIKDGVISTAKLADASVSTPKIIDTAVTTQKIALGAITADRILDNAVLNTKMHWNTGLHYDGYQYTAAPVLSFTEDALTFRQGKDGYPIAHLNANGFALCGGNRVGEVSSVSVSTQTDSWSCEADPNLDSYLYAFLDTDGDLSDNSYFEVYYSEGHPTPPYHAPVDGGTVRVVTANEQFTGIITGVYNDGNYHSLTGKTTALSCAPDELFEAPVEIYYERTEYIYTFNTLEDLTSVLSPGDRLSFEFEDMTYEVSSVTSSTVVIITTVPIENYEHITYLERPAGSYSILQERYVYGDGTSTSKNVLDVEPYITGYYGTRKDRVTFFKDRQVNSAFPSGLSVGGTNWDYYPFSVIGNAKITGQASVGSLFVDNEIYASNASMTVRSLTTTQSLNGWQYGSHSYDYPGSGTWLVIAKFRINAPWLGTNFVGEYLSDARWQGIRLLFTVSMGCEGTFGQGLSHCSVMYEGVGWPTPNISEFFRVVVTEDTATATTFQIQVFRGVWLSGNWAIKNNAVNYGAVTIYNTAVVGDPPIVSSCPIYYRNKRFEGNIGIGKNPGAYSLDTVSTINSTGYFRNGINLDTIYAASAHNHDSTYLKLSGGTLTNTLTINKAATSYNSLLSLQDTGTLVNSETGIDWYNSQYAWNQGRLSMKRWGDTSSSFDMLFYTSTNGTMTEKMRLSAGGHLTLNNRNTFPSLQWSQSNNSTGAVVITLPGGTTNHGMSVFEITVYEYNANNATKYIFGGHNWGNNWYSYGGVKIGNSNKNIRLGSRNNRYVIIIGEVDSTWSYGHVTLTMSTNPGFYASPFNSYGNWEIQQTTDLSDVINLTAKIQNNVWHEGNDGSGSGLDADLLDGNHASAFSLTSHTHNVFREVFTTSTEVAAGTAITIPNSRTYTVSSNKLLVFLNGDLQYILDDYTEFSNTQIKFTFALPTGAKILFYILG